MCVRVQCDTVRPTCSTCVKRGTRCAYNTVSHETHTQALKRKYEEVIERDAVSQEFLRVCISRPEHETYNIIRCLRNGTDIKTIVRQVTDGNLLLQLSLVPETSYRYDFPFFHDMPAYLKLDNNPYLKSALYDQAFAKHPPSPPSPKERPGRSAAVSPYLKPFHVAELVEPLLAGVNVSKWTDVSSDNDLLRRLVSAYILHEYDWFPVFQKDHFLKDLSSGRDRFCSPLLVNAVLAAACVSRLCWKYGIPPEPFLTYP
jgi:hypothetical protein